MVANTLEKVAGSGCLIEENTLQILVNRICALEGNPVVDTDDQTLSTTVAGGVTTQVTISEGNTIDILHPEHICPEILTRAQLRALATAGNLDMSCHYLIADASNGCLGDVIIELHPVSTDKLSSNVSVHTTHDVEAWQGTYDITSNTIETLQDNTGNFVRGDGQNEVNAFPWGNTAWRDVTVENAVVNVECDTTLQVWNTKFDKASNTDLRGATGFIRYSDIGEGAIIQLNGAAVSITSSTFDSRARIYGNGSTAVVLTELHMDSEAYWNFAGRNDVRAIYVHMNSASRVYYTGGTRQWLYYTNLSSYAHIRQFAGIVQMYYSDMASYAEFRNEVGAGTATIYGASWDSRAYIRNFSTVLWRSYYDAVSSRGEILLRGAANKTTYYSHISGYGWMHLLDTSTIAYAIEIGSNARFIMNGGNHYRNRFGSYSRVTTAFNTRNIYTDGSFAQTLTAANSNTYRGFGTNTLA